MLSCPFAVQSCSLAYLHDKHLALDLGLTVHQPSVDLAIHVQSALRYCRMLGIEERYPQCPGVSALHAVALHLVRQLLQWCLVSLSSFWRHDELLSNVEQEVRTNLMAARRTVTKTGGET